MQETGQGRGGGGLTMLMGKSSGVARRSLETREKLEGGTRGWGTTARSERMRLVRLGRRDSKTRVSSVGQGVSVLAPGSLATFVLFLYWLQDMDAGLVIEGPQPGSSVSAQVIGAIAVVPEY
ncbi:hypothetical protein LIA77_10929 [Sarocladium implicatum]|nr:hypothetical protein LIA77_10929 [Sarocladium implicatum]